MCRNTILIIFLLWDSSQGNQAPRVSTPLGEIRGYHKQSYGGRIFSAFEGIPFAKPPVGNLRFKEPQHAESWSGIWNATTVHECIQLDWPQTAIIGNEDCLYLNIYVPGPQPEPSEELDVLVLIHGGAFMLGSPKLAGPDYLMDRDIIYVSINYRVGVLGFLSTEDNVVPGNNGMKDQVFALKWIQDNISHFGGNPKSVTIAGESAGAASVHFHYLSPLSKGLFHRGISHSGTALAPWTIQEAALIKARQLAASVGCNQQLIQEFIDCMKQRSAKHLIQNVDIFYTNYKLPFSPFAPTIEQKRDSSFLTDYPFNLLNNGQVYDAPWIASVTTEEGIFPAILLVDILDKVEEEWNDIMPHSLDYNYTVTDSDKTIVSQKIKEFYFGEEKLSHDNFKTLIKLFSDRHFHIDFEVASLMQAKAIKSPVYTLVYGYRGEKTLSSYFQSNSNEYYGVSHADDSLLIYSMDIPGFSTVKRLSNSDKSVKELLLNIVTSFAKKGKPQLEKIKWKPVTVTDNFRYLFLQKPDQMEMISRKKSQAIAFWASLPILENENIIPLKDEL